MISVTSVSVHLDCMFLKKILLFKLEMFLYIENKNIIINYDINNKK